LEWQRACPDEHKQFVSQIADCFGIKNREEKIAERAYELWQQRNQEHGNDVADTPISFIAENLPDKTQGVGCDLLRKRLTRSTPASL
jgi:Protein of unknown function (DUF2934)